MQKLIGQDETAEAALSEQKEALEKASGEISESLGKIDQWETSQRREAELKTLLKEETAERERRKTKLEAQQAKIPLSEKAKEERVRLEAQLRQYEALETLRGDILKDQAREQQTEKAALALRNRIADSEASLQKEKQERQTLDRAGEMKATLRMQKDKAVARQNALASLRDDLTERQNQIKTLEALQRDYRNAAGNYDRAKETYDAMNRAFLDEQAGIIAESLAPGMPCPVCGSTTHPRLAVKSEHAPTEARLKEAKRQMETADGTARRKSDQCHSTKAKAEALGDKIGEALFDLGLPDDLPEAPALLPGVIREVMQPSLSSNSRSYT